MVYLIPSWPNEIKQFTADPTISLSQMFLRYGDIVKLLIVDFRPQLRYQLNVNNLSSLEYDAVWDAILGIKRKEGMPLEIEDLELPSKAEFVYYTNSILVYIKGHFIAKIELSAANFPEKVIFATENDQLKEIDEYDDRGFLACKNFVDGRERTVVRIWFDDSGTPILRYDRRLKMSVQVLNDDENRYDYGKYLDVNDVIAEFSRKLLQHKFDSTEDELLFHFTGHDVELLTQITAITPATLISTGSNNLSSGYSECTLALAASVQQIVADSDSRADQWRSLLQSESINTKVITGYPYSMDLRLGNSNEEDVMPIYWRCLTETAEQREITMLKIFDQIWENEQFSLIVEVNTQLNGHDVSDRILENLKKHLTKISFVASDDFFKLIAQIDTWDRSAQFQRLFGMDDADESQNKSNGIQKDRNKFLNLMSKITIHSISKKARLRQELNRARVVLDLSPVLDRYVVMESISAGVPIITVQPDELIIDRGNGWVVTQTDSLEEGLRYFLHNLRNWNQALVDSTQMIEEYTSKRQFDFWKESLHKNDK